MTAPVWRVPLAVGAVGLAAATGVASLDGMAAGATARLLLYACAGAAAAGGAAAGLLRLRRRAGITTQAVVAALAPLVAVAIGCVWAASEMFLMPHDLWVLLVVLLAAGTVGTITAIALGRRVAAASREVTAMARGIGGTDPAAPRHGPGELLALAAEIESAATRVRVARRQAEEVESGRRELVAGVSHDLRTPLAGIRAMIEALEDGVVSDPETVAGYHASIRNEADRLSALVDDLFELSRLQSGALRLELEPVPLGDFVVDLVTTAAAGTGRPVTVTTTVRRPGSVVAMAVPEIVRVVRNLLDNAVRHTPDGGAVVVDAGTGAGRAWISVSDGCGGIPEPDLGRVFDTGFRGDPARTPGRGGGGLGLAVARGLVHAHGGEIDVVNVGDGCRFTVRLPARTAGDPDRLTRTPAGHA